MTASLTNMTKLASLCVYCGSAAGDLVDYANAARALGSHLGRQKIRLVYGGGNVGLMGIVATAALDAGGTVIGVIPRALMDKELGLERCTALHVVENMHERKKLMADLSDGFIAMPGGIGTLEEFFEAFTWQQLRFHDKPLGLLNTCGFYDGLLAFLQHATDAGFLTRAHLASLRVNAEPEALMQLLADWTPTHDPKWKALRPDAR